MAFKDNQYLFLGGLGSFFVALLHVFIMMFGAPAYRYFGAGEEMAILAENGSIIPTITTTGITLVFLLFAIYAFAGSQLLRPLPLVKPVIFLIGSIYSMRGLAVVYFLYLLLFTIPQEETYRHAVFSLVSLILGILYLAGFLALRKSK